MKCSYIFSKHTFAQNQSFEQKEVGQNIYFLKRASISLFVGVGALGDPFSYNVTSLTFKQNRLKTILIRHKFKLNYNLYMNFNFIKFLITIYIIIYKIFLKNL